MMAADRSVGRMAARGGTLPAGRLPPLAQGWQYPGEALQHAQTG